MPLEEAEEVARELDEFGYRETEDSDEAEDRWRYCKVEQWDSTEGLRILGTAFDLACAVLGRTPQPIAMQEAIARNIVEAAQQGERDLHHLCDAGLAAVKNVIVVQETKKWTESQD